MNNEIAFADAMVADFLDSLGETIQPAVCSQGYLPVAEGGHNTVVWARWSRLPS
jgi:hypothetical protein